MTLPAGDEYQSPPCTSAQLALCTFSIVAGTYPQCPQLPFLHPHSYVSHFGPLPHVCSFYSSNFHTLAVGKGCAMGHEPHSVNDHRKSCPWELCLPPYPTYSVTEESHTVLLWGSSPWQRGFCEPQSHDSRHLAREDAVQKTMLPAWASQAQGPCLSVEKKHARLCSWPCSCLLSRIVQGRGPFYPDRVLTSSESGPQLAAGIIQMNMQEATLFLVCGVFS